MKSWVYLAQEFRDLLRLKGTTRGSIAAGELTNEFITRHNVSANTLQRAVAAFEFVLERFPNLLSDANPSTLQLSKVELLKRIDTADPSFSIDLIQPILTGNISLRELRRLHALKQDTKKSEDRDRRSNTKFMAMKFDKAVFNLISTQPSLVGATDIAHPSTELRRIRFLSVDAVGQLENGGRLGVMSRYLSAQSGQRTMIDANLPLSVFFSSSFFDRFVLVIPDHTDRAVVDDLCKWLHEFCKVHIEIALLTNPASESDCPGLRRFCPH
jgi:hypothetical protein